MKNKTKFKKQIKNKIAVNRSRRYNLNRNILDFYDAEFQDIETLNDIYLHNNRVEKTVNKTLQQIKNDYHEETDSCLFCKSKFKENGKNKRACNSHNIPAFVLNDLARYVNKSKSLATISTIVRSPNYPYFAGVRQCDTFRLICNACDHKRFRNYEDTKILFNLDSKTKDEMQTILREIALKIVLKDVYYYNVENCSLPDINELTKKLNKTNKNNTKAANNKLKHVLNHTCEYDLLFCEKLDYNVGFTVQDKLFPNTLYKSDRIHDLMNHSNANESYLYVCVYPVGEETLVLIFSDSHNKGKYSEYAKFLELGSIEDILQNVSFNLLKFTEKIFFNPEIFTDDLWTEKDKLLTKYFYSEIHTEDSKRFRRPIGTSEDYLKFKSVNERTVTNLFQVSTVKIDYLLGLEPHEFFENRHITNYYDFINYFRDTHDIYGKKLNSILHQPLKLDYNREYISYAKTNKITLLDIEKMSIPNKNSKSATSTRLKYKDFLNSLLFFVDCENDFLDNDFVCSYIYLSSFHLRADNLLSQIIGYENRKVNPIYNNLPIKLHTEKEEFFDAPDVQQSLCIARLLGSKYIKVSW